MPLTTNGVLFPLPTFGTIVVVIGFVGLVVCRNWLETVLILIEWAGIWVCECDAGHCCYACSWLVGRRIFNGCAFVSEFSLVVVFQWEFCKLELAHDLL